jgi:hypothetical protein
MASRDGRQLWIAVALAALSLVPAGCRAAQQQKTASVEDFDALVEQIGELTAKVSMLAGAPDDVDIVLTGSGTTIRLHSMNHKVKGVCQRQVSDCDDHVTWHLLNMQRMPSTYQVKIVEKTGGSNTTAGCFKPEYVLDGNHDSVNSGPPAEKCQKPNIIWQYDVILYDGSTQLGDPIDPLLVMNWGP